MSKNYLVWVVLTATLGGCQYQASNWCSDAPFHNCKDLVDGPIDAAPSCSSNASCTAPLGVCDVTGSKTCVECTATDSAACVGVEPVCGVDQACRACTAHSECPSDVCLPDGSCAAEGDVAYVNGSIGTGSACTKAAPCKTVTAAIATPKAVIKVTGAAVEPAKVVISSARQIFGAANATVRASGGMTTIFEIPTGGNLAVHQLDVGGTTNLKPDRCYQIPSSATGQLTLVDGKVSNCVIGVESLSSGGTVTVTGATVSGNTGTGITSSGGTVTVTGATVTTNKGGGVSVTAGTFKVSNSVIADNGDASNGGSDFGGVILGGAGIASELTQNTIVGNLQKPTALGAGGVTCTVAAFAGERNIIAGNTASVTAMQVTGCTYPNSFLAGNFTSLMFADPGTLNFHLTAASPATVKDVAGLTTCPGVDIDGNARPVNTFCDLGADEYKP